MVSWSVWDSLGKASETEGETTLWRHSLKSDIPTSNCLSTPQTDVLCFPALISGWPWKCRTTLSLFTVTTPTRLVSDGYIISRQRQELVSLWDGGDATHFSGTPSCSCLSFAESSKVAKTIGTISHNRNRKKNSQCG